MHSLPKHTIGHHHAPQVHSEDDIFNWRWILSSTLIQVMLIIILKNVLILRLIHPVTTPRAPCYWSSPVLCLLYGNCWPSTFWQLSQIISRKFSPLPTPLLLSIQHSAITRSTFPRPENVALFIFAKSKFSSWIGREREPWRPLEHSESFNFSLKMSIDSKPFSFSFEKIQHSTSFHPIFEKNVFKKEFLETIFNDNKRRCNSVKKMCMYDYHILSYALLTLQLSSQHKEVGCLKLSPTQLKHLEEIII